MLFKQTKGTFIANFESKWWFLGCHPGIKQMRKSNWMISPGTGKKTKLKQLSSEDISHPRSTKYCVSRQYFFFMEAVFLEGTLQCCKFRRIHKVHDTWDLIHGYHPQKYMQLIPKYDYDCCSPSFQRQSRRHLPTKINCPKTSAPTIYDICFGVSTKKRRPNTWLPSGRVN